MTIKSASVTGSIDQAVDGSSQLVIDEQNPWPGLGSFDESAERFFNGRTHETAELRRLVLQAPLTVLFGASGLGKTSLVQAGLFPAMRKNNYLPVYVRLDVRDRNAPLIEQVKFALQTQIRNQHVEAPAFTDLESFWHYLHRAGMELWSSRNQLLTPVFVFDQFEEVFTLGAENAAAIARLRTDLSDLIENRLPARLSETIRENESTGAGLSLDSQRYKIVLSFREDFLPALEGWKRELPSILRNRLRLLPMSGEHAFEAVYATASHLVEESLAREIVRFVAAAQGEATGQGPETFGEMPELAVEPSLLSLVCHGLNEKRKAQGKEVFDKELLEGSGKSIISDYYSKAVGDMPALVHRFVENELITERGFRKPCDIDDARTVHGVSDLQLRVLVDRRLLRIEPVRGTERVELTHDLLTRVVREHRDRQREKERSRRQRRRTAAFAALGVLLVALVATFSWLSLKAWKEHLNAKKESISASIARDVAARALGEVRGTQQELALNERDLKIKTDEVIAVRRDADQQLAIATALRLAGEALRKFGPATDMALSGALAMESLNTAPTLEGRQALSQLLRLMPLAPKILPAHKREVWSLAFSRDGHWMASGEQGTIILWDVANQMKKTALEGPPAGPAMFGLAFSYDGRWLAAGGMGTLWIWETETGKRTQQVIDLKGYVRSIAFSPDGLHMAAASRDTGVQLFQKAAGQWEEVKPSTSGKDTGRVSAVVFTTNDSLALAGTMGISGNQYGVWFTNLDLENAVPLPVSSAGECHALALSQDSFTLAARCRDGIVTAWREDVEKAFAPSSGKHHPVLGTGSDFGISLSPNGSYVAAQGSHSVVHVAAVAENWTAEESTLLTLPLVSVAFRPDGKVLAAGLADGSIALWPTTHGAESIRFQSEGVVTGLAFSADEKWLAMTSEDGVVRVFDVRDGRDIRRSNSFRIGPEISNPLFSPDGHLLAVRDKKAVYLIQTKPWKRLPQRDLFGAFDTTAFSLDSRTLITVGDGRIHRFDTATWQEKKPAITYEGRSSNTIQLSPDGRWLATEEQVPAGRHIRVDQRDVWNLVTGMETAWKETLSGEPHAASSRPPQGGPQSLISDSRKWRTVNDKSLSPDGEWRANLDRNGSTLEIQEASSKAIVARLEHDGDVIDLAFSPRSRWLATASKDGTLRLWPLQTKEIIEQACKLLPRNLTPDEWRQLKIDGPYHKTCPNLP